MLLCLLIATSFVSGLVVHTPNTPEVVYHHVSSTNELDHPIHHVPLVLANPLDSCTSLQNNIIGKKVVLIERGNCSFQSKIANAQVEWINHVTLVITCT